MDNEKKISLDILKEAISIELHGRESYWKFSKEVSDENAKSIFIGLFYDEEEHLALLKEEYKKIAGEDVDIKKLKFEYSKKVHTIFPENIISDDITKTKDILKIVISLEKKLSELYAESSEKADNNSAKKLFSKLADFEKEHHARLQMILEYLEQEGSWYGYSFYTRWFHPSLTN